MKAESSTIATPYAEAVLALAAQEKEAEAEAVLNDLVTINQLIQVHPDLNTMLNHPAIYADEKRKILTILFKTRVKELTMRLVELLLDKRRLSLLPAIETEFRVLLNARKNIVSASLICADKLSETAVANIKARLTEHLGRRLELSVKEDSSLIGGVVLRLGDQVIDGSLKGKLRNLERSLMSV